MYISLHIYIYFFWVAYMCIVYLSRNQGEIRHGVKLDNQKAHGNGSSMAAAASTHQQALGNGRQTHGSSLTHQGQAARATIGRAAT